MGRRVAVIIAFSVAVVLASCSKGKEEVTGKESTSGIKEASLLEQGMQSVRSGELEEAEKYFRQALELNPNYIEALNNLGAVLTQLERYEEADSILRRAIELDSTYAIGYFNLGKNCFEWKKYDDGIEALNTGLAIKEDAGAYLLLGDCLDRKHKFKESLEAYLKSAEMDSTNPRVHYSIGNSLVSQGKYKDAIPHYKKAIELYPKYADAYNNLGVAYAALKDYKEAEEVIKKAIELKPDYPAAYMNLALCYENQGYHTKAAEEMKKYLKYAPEDAPDREFVKGKMEELRKLPDGAKTEE